MRGKFLLLFAVVMKTWGLLIILTELLMCRRQGEERYFTTGQAGVIGMGFRENGFPDIREQGRLDFSFLLQQRPQPLAPAFWGRHLPTATYCCFSSSCFIFSSSFSVLRLH